MKRVRILALVMVCALMLMGVGYAVWNDELTLTTTVDMGEFDAVITSPAVTFDSSNTTEGLDVATATIVTDSNFDDSLLIELNNLYPGAQGTIKFKVANTGTIPMKFASMDTEVASDVHGYVANADLAGHIFAKVLYGDNVDTASTYLYGTATNYGGAFIDMETPILGSSLNTVILKPNTATVADTTEDNGTAGEYIYFEIPFKVDDFSDHEDDSVALRVSLTWEQFNTPVADL